jgi:hypothetical protein
VQDDVVEAEAAVKRNADKVTDLEDKMKVSIKGTSRVCIHTHTYTTRARTPTQRALRHVHVGYFYDCVVKILILAEILSLPGVEDKVDGLDQNDEELTQIFAQIEAVKGM